MSQKTTLSLTVVEALDARIRGPIADRLVARADDLAPAAVADRAILQYGVGLDEEQREAMAKTTMLLDEARQTQSTLEARRPAPFVDQHRIEMNRETTLLKVGELLEAARLAAASASVELRITADQIWSTLVDGYVWRVVLKALPAKTARRAAA